MELCVDWAMEGGAGEAEALRDTSEVLCGEVANARDDQVNVVIEVICFVFDKALWRAAKVV